MAEIGRRPVVVLSRDAVIPRHLRSLVAPCTTTIRGLVSEVGLEPGEDPVPRRCVVNLDSVDSVSVAVLVERLGRLADTRMRQICGALAVAVDCADLRCSTEAPSRKHRRTVAMPSATVPHDRPGEPSRTGR